MKKMSNWELMFCIWTLSVHMFHVTVKTTTTTIMNSFDCCPQLEQCWRFDIRNQRLPLLKTRMLWDEVLKRNWTELKWKEILLCSSQLVLTLSLSLSVAWFCSPQQQWRFAISTISQRDRDAHSKLNRDECELCSRWYEKNGIGSRFFVV